MSQWIEDAADEICNTNSNPEEDFGREIVAEIIEKHRDRWIDATPALQVGGLLDQAAAEQDRLRKALHDLLAYAMTAKRNNTPEWMAEFATRLNAALEVYGDESRAKWPGKWAHEFHYELE